jgi:O-antigen ligase
MSCREKKWTATLLSLMMVLVPALGVPHEELLQDTFKSMLVAFFALASSFTFFWHQRKQAELLKWHGVMILPMALMAYAAGSMGWSHTYLAGVEAIRWFLFSLILLLGVNTFSFDRLTGLAWGIHLGAVIASLWAALQFWVEFKFFSQGPIPASTFVNRNFFGEFLVCTIPFSVLLLTRVKDKTSVFLLTFSLGFNIVALMMTGTRSALLGLLVLGILIPAIVIRYGKQITSNGWRTSHCVAIFVLFTATIATIGSIDARNSTLISENGNGDAIDRAINRTLSITNATEYSQGSFSIRTELWKTTGSMIAANAFTGVGAGAWEVKAPLYQAAGSQLETDYYAHNEILQLLAEYGFTGWVFIVGLLVYLSTAAFRTVANHTLLGRSESLLRALTLTSLFVFLMVSNAGFPWRLATTGALFAISLGVLAASDLRLNAGKTFRQSIPWPSRYSTVALCTTAICTGIALHISHQAVVCEEKIIRAVKIAMTISKSGQPNDPDWKTVKEGMLTLLKQGIAINPHYRKLTPMVADSLATWGDLGNATWIWESVLESRPNVVAMLANVVRGHLQKNEFSLAQSYLDKAKRIQPTAPALEALQVVLWSQTGKVQEAITHAGKLLNTGVIDPDLLRVAYFLGKVNGDPALANLALKLHIKNFPNQTAEDWLKLGGIFGATETKEDLKVSPRPL